MEGSCNLSFVIRYLLFDIEESSQFDFSNYK